MSRKLGRCIFWQASFAVLLSSPAAARYGGYRSGCMPDDEPCMSEPGMWVMVALFVAFWVSCIVTQLRQGELWEAFLIFLMGLAFGGFWWVMDLLLSS